MRTFIIRTSMGDYEIVGDYVEIDEGYIVVYMEDEAVAMFYKPYSVIPKGSDGKSNPD